jgi:hypothetical protein
MKHTLSPIERQNQEAARLKSDRKAKVHAFRDARRAEGSKTNPLAKFKLASKEAKDRRLIKGVTGTFYDVFNFRPWMVNINDIATGLSKKCRWNGQIPGDEIFSVAQHSVAVSRLMGSDPWYRMLGLLHDGSEGLMVDLITPMKTEMPDFQAIEDHVQATIYTHFELSITPQMDHALHAADRLCLEYEANQFERDLTWVMTDRKFCDVFSMPIMGCAEAKKLFIAEFNSIVTEILTA